MIVEIVCCRYADVQIAKAAGADRIELCAAIEVGGLTPSLGLVETTLNLGIPLVVMLRPRPAGFAYDYGDFGTMLRDLSALAKLPIKRFISGCLFPDGRIDRDRMARLRESAPDHEWAMHRAFDAVPDQSESLETLIELGYTAVLTSGGKSKATEAVSEVRNLIDQATGRIEVVPAGGLRPSNVARFAKETGATCVHLAPFQWNADLSATLAVQHGISYGPQELPRDAEYRETNPADVAAVVAALKAA